MHTSTPSGRAAHRIDVVSIFPSYFDGLALSLLGKARDSGILDVQVHDLRDWTSDRHRTVDDTPYGGGAGMVMKAEPWALALDELAGSSRPTIIFPSPAGEVFRQTTARDFALREHLIIGCGRYEGIDERVFEYAAALGDVRLVSLGDYVLNGGEVAAMAMIEAVGRLIPGSSATRRASSRNRTRTDCWSTRLIRSRRHGGIVPSRRFCSAATMPPSRRGGTSSKSSARACAVRIC